MKFDVIVRDFRSTLLVLKLPFDLLLLLEVECHVWRLQDDDIAIEDGLSLTFFYFYLRLDVTFGDLRTTILVLKMVSA